VKRTFAIGIAVFAGLCALEAEAGFRTPESLVRNVYAYYGSGAPDLSHGLPHDEATTERFFDPSLRQAWRGLRNEPYDFLVQSTTWKIGRRREFRQPGTQGHAEFHPGERPGGLADHRCREPA